jgi:hypothetical protein
MEKTFFSLKNIELLQNVIESRLQAETGIQQQLNSEYIFSVMKYIWENANAITETETPQKYIIKLNNFIVEHIVSEVINASSSPPPPPTPLQQQQQQPLRKHKKKQEHITVIQEKPSPPPPPPHQQSQPLPSKRRRPAPVVATPTSVVVSRPPPPPPPPPPPTPSQSQQSQYITFSDNENSDSDTDTNTNNNDNDNDSSSGTLSMENIQEIMLNQMQPQPDPIALQPPPLPLQLPSPPHYEFIHSSRIKDLSDAKSFYSIDVPTHLKNKENIEVALVSANIPKSEYTITKTNCWLKFFEIDGKELLASIPVGYYSDIHSILLLLETNMNEVGSSTYTCKMHPQTFQIIITSTPTPNSDAKVYMFHLNGDGLGDLLGFKCNKIYTGSLEHISDFPYSFEIASGQSNVQLYIEKTMIANLALHSNKIINTFDFNTSPLFFKLPNALRSSFQIEFKNEKNRYYNFQGQNHSFVLAFK